MSSNRFDRRRAPRHLCAACRERRARYRYRGEVRADRQHVLCFQCFRAAREQMRAWEIRGGMASLPGPVTPRLVEHRRLMLSHLEKQAAALLPYLGGRNSG